MDRNYEGDGFSDIYNYVKNVLTNSKSSSTDKYLKKYSAFYVKTIAIYRTPIDAPIQKLVDKVVGNKKVEYKDIGYDVLFHLYMILELENPKNRDDKVYLLTEKRPNVIWETRKNISSKAKNAQYIKLIPPKRNIDGYLMPPTFGKMINCSVLHLGKNFNTYEAGTNNCQTYILSLVECLGLTGYQSFILQPVSDIIEKIGFGRAIAKKVTDLAHFFGRVVGHGIHFRTNEGITGIPLRGGDIGDNGAAILDNATEVLGIVAPEAKPIIAASQAIAGVIISIFGKRSKFQEEIANHQAIDKKYGPSFKAVVQKYGINSDDVAIYANTFPERIYTYYYIYNTPNVPSSGLKYPQNYQDLAIYENTVSDANIHGLAFVNKVKPYALSIGINYDDPKTQQIMEQIQGDKFRLGTYGHY